MRRCKQCGQAEVGEVKLSLKTLCPACFHARMVANTKGLIAREGPEWERWKAGCERARRRKPGL